MKVYEVLRELADQLEVAEGALVKEVEYWPSSIPGQQVERITGDPSIDFTVAMLGGKPKPTPERDHNLELWGEHVANTVYTGLFPARNFMHGPSEGTEASFIYAASRIYRQRNDERGHFNSDMYRDAGLFSGTHTDIANLISYGEQEQIFTHKSYEDTLADFPDTPVKRTVMDVLAAVK